MTCKTRVMARVAAGVFAVALLAPGAAFAQNALQSYMGAHGWPAHFWADADGHTIVATGTPHRYRVCNLPHMQDRGQPAALMVDADGTQTELQQGHCADVEGAKIMVMSGTPDATAMGSYQSVD